MAPVGPVGPVGPVAPVGPVLPIAPVAPVGPVLPIAPVAPAAAGPRTMFPPAPINRQLGPVPEVTPDTFKLPLILMFTPVLPTLIKLFPLAD